MCTYYHPQPKKKRKSVKLVAIYQTKNSFCEKEMNNSNNKNNKTTILFFKYFKRVSGKNLSHLQLDTRVFTLFHFSGVVFMSRKDKERRTLPFM